ncbi:hypothetical protein SUGI_0071730 [Cryptomeria japonica]|nr:hypothetical protein SUGI_0071730 [Cryptomeria japonica]
MGGEPHLPLQQVNGHFFENHLGGKKGVRLSRSSQKHSTTDCQVRKKLTPRSWVPRRLDKTQQPIFDICGSDTEEFLSSPNNISLLRSFPNNIPFDHNRYSAHLKS